MKHQHQIKKKKEQPVILSPSSINLYITNPSRWIEDWIEKECFQYIKTETNTHWYYQSPSFRSKFACGIERFLNDNLDKSTVKNLQQIQDLQEYGISDQDLKFSTLPTILLKRMNHLFSEIDGPLDLQKNIKHINSQLLLSGRADYCIGEKIFELKVVRSLKGDRIIHDKRVDDAIRQIMIYRGWSVFEDSLFEDFELKNACIILGILGIKSGIKDEPRVHFLISEDMREFFCEEECTIIPEGVVSFNSAILREAAEGIMSICYNYKNNGAAEPPMLPLAKEYYTQCRGFYRDRLLPKKSVILNFGGMMSLQKQLTNFSFTKERKWQ